MRAAYLIHGFATDKNDFIHLAPLLSGQYDCVYAPDLPYHGKGKQKAKLNCDHIIDFVINKFDLLKQKYDTVDVFGFSMGGACATLLASQRQVNRLVLLAPANKYFSIGYGFALTKYYIESGAKPNPRKKNRVLMASNPLDVRKDNSDATKMFFKTLLPRYSLKNLSEFGKIIKRCNAALKPIDAPALIIWGQIDQLVPQSSIKFVRRYCISSKTRQIVYGDISHYMLYSRAFFKILDDIFLFLSQTSTPLLTYLPKN